MRTRIRVANGISKSEVNITTVVIQDIEHQNILSLRRSAIAEIRDAPSNVLFVERITTSTNVHKISQS